MENYNDDVCNKSLFNAYCKEVIEFVRTAFDRGVFGTMTYEEALVKSAISGLAEPEFPNSKAALANVLLVRNERVDQWQKEREAADQAKVAYEKGLEFARRLARLANRGGQNSASN